MKYSPTHDAFIITKEEIKLVSMSFQYAMRQARKIAGVPMGRRLLEGGLKPIDHLEKGLIEAADTIGIDYGTRWGNEIDLSDVGEN